MAIRGLLSKRNKLNEEAMVSTTQQPPNLRLQVNTPEFTIMRSDTYTQEILTTSVPQNTHAPGPFPPVQSAEPTSKPGLFSLLKPRSRAPSSASTTSSNGPSSPVVATLASPVDGRGRRLSQRLGLRRSDLSSEHVPQNLPEISINTGEETWEERATMLASCNARERSRSRPPTVHGGDDTVGLEGLDLGHGNRSEKGNGTIADEGKALKEADDNLQEAIRLHEAGDLVHATEMFGRLADPNGQNNALSQVLYGLALRHGWGCTADSEKALRYLTAAASNAASIEDMALKSGNKQGGSAKGELVLAIFELGNSFQHGWGVKKDPVAAKQYYETAANLGDTDAMNEVGRCYLEGIGCKKDKQASARYYRRAEKKGHKTIGNTWIWKEKYDPPK